MCVIESLEMEQITAYHLKALLVFAGTYMDTVSILVQCSLYYPNIMLASHH